MCKYHDSSPLTCRFRLPGDIIYWNYNLRIRLGLATSVMIHSLTSNWPVLLETHADRDGVLGNDRFRNDCVRMIASGRIELGMIT
eukprot:511140-Amorphochlora_amoeboformis.AAC.2